MMVGAQKKGRFVMDWISDPIEGRLVMLQSIHIQYMFPNAVAVLCNMCTRDFSSLLSPKVDTPSVLPIRLSTVLLPRRSSQYLQTTLSPDFTVRPIIFPFHPPFHLGAALSIKNPGSGRLSALSSSFVFASATSSTFTNSLTFII